jgi:SUMO ligase MMS21 Smc5/6 complex component
MLAHTPSHTAEDLKTKGNLSGLSVKFTYSYSLCEYIHLLFTEARNKSLFQSS